MTAKSCRSSIAVINRLNPQLSNSQSACPFKGPFFDYGQYSSPTGGVEYATRQLMDLSIDCQTA
jgi:hypothetical protein